MIYPEVCTEGTKEALRDPEVGTDGTEKTLRDLGVAIYYEKF